MAGSCTEMWVTWLGGWPEQISACPPDAQKEPKTSSGANLFIHLFYSSNPFCKSCLQQTQARPWGCLLTLSHGNAFSRRLFRVFLLLLVPCMTSGRLMIAVVKEGSSVLLLMALRALKISVLQLLQQVQCVSSIYVLRKHVTNKRTLARIIIMRSLKLIAMLSC